MSWLRWNRESNHSLLACWNLDMTPDHFLGRSMLAFWSVAKKNPQVGNSGSRELLNLGGSSVRCSMLQLVLRNKKLSNMYY